MGKEKKQMLSVSKENNQTIVKINYSSLEILQTCLRKAYYYFIRDLKKTVESPALTFGSAVHKAMEVWYCTPTEVRKEFTPHCSDAQAAMAYGHADDALQHGRCARCASIFAFIEAMGDLKFVEDTDKRSVSNGIDILNDYFSENLGSKDPFIIYEDDMGPCIERHVEYVIYETSDLKIIYFGTIDAIWKQINTGKLYVVDHKTTYSLGKEFLQRHRPNFQYSGYLLGAKEHLGIDTEAFIVNGIQVAKTVRGFRRIFTFREEADFHELRNAVVHHVKRYLEALNSAKLLAANEGFVKFPMTCPNPCTMYGGCTYHDICAATDSTREPIIRSLYDETIGPSENEKL